MKRRLAAEAATGRDLKARQAVVLPLIGRHGGRVIDIAGDGILAEFPSVIAAAECALEIRPSWPPATPTCPTNPAAAPRCSAAAGYRERSASIASMTEQLNQES